MARRVRVRRTRVSVYHCETNPGWGSSTIKLIDSSTNSERTEVIINIERPSDLTYLEEQFKLIREGWRRMLNG